MTGKYAHENGVYKFTALDQTQPTLPKNMQANGYHTAIVGKYHLHSNPIGMDYFSVLPGQGDYFDPEFIEVGNTHPSGWIQQGKRTVYKGHSSDVIADRALDYLQNLRNPEKPFMLFAHFKAPHDRWEYAPRYESFLADVDIPEPDNLFDDYEGRSDALKKQLQYIGSDWGDHTNFETETAHLDGQEKKKLQYQLYMKKYLRCVKGVDDNVGRILNYLDESGLAENTIVIYTGDQGFYLGEHGMYDKRFMYEEGLRMPFLVRWPDVVKAGSTSDGMILNVDFAPTMLEAAGLDPLEGSQGRSFIQLLQGEVPDDWRNSMYYRYYYSHFETEPHYGVRTMTHKLIYYNRLDQWELYDLEEDRSEMNNLYENPDYMEITENLKSEMYRLQKELGDNPNDDGSNPDIGRLEGDPVFQAEDIKLSEGDISMLFRFKSDQGGTLFSQSRIGDVPWSEEIADDGMKTLYLRNDQLVYSDFEQNDDGEVVFEGNLLDSQWHTIGFLVKDGYPSIYVDGELEYTGSETVSKDNPMHTFNVGAGIDFSGYNGYNFIGEISHAFVFGTVLNERVIQGFHAGELVEETPILEFINQ